MTIERMECTCSACPTQYDIYLTDGRNVYLRYRWGHLRIELEGEVIYEWDHPGEKDEHGINYDGSMELREVVSHLAKAGIYTFD